MIDLYKEERTHLLHRFLNRTFFKVFSGWGKHEQLMQGHNASSVELQISPSCDLKCKYCYYSRFSNIGPHGELGLYPTSIYRKRNVIKNLKLLLEWFAKYNMFPNFDLFSGEIFSSEVGFEVLEILVEWFIKHDVRYRRISIPTNMNFCTNEEKKQRVIRLINKALEHRFRIGLSASIDGKFCDENRPFQKGGHVRDYDAIFKFSKDIGCGFHPMVYYDNIDKWIDNWLWFQEMFDKYGLPWDNIYLLEVRNNGWTIDHVKHFQKFINFFVKWTKKKTGLDEIGYARWAAKNPINIFSCFSSIGRGIGCSIQSDIQIRLSDLTVNPCHRLSYPQFNSFKFVEMYDQIVSIDPLNTELLYAIYTTDTKNFPYCQDCGIKYLCGGGCLGSQYETMGDIFTPIPSMCMMEHGKISAIIDSMDEVGSLTHIYNLINKDVKDNLIIYEKYLKANRR